MARLLFSIDPPRRSHLLLAFLALSISFTDVDGVSEPLELHHRRLRVFGRDDRVQVPSAAASPYSAIGLLRWNAETLCTASLVADAIVVTAAECVLDQLGDELPRDVDQPPVFFPGVTDSSIASLESPSANVVGVYKQSDYWVKWTDNTYVLLSLDSPLGSTLGTLGLPTLGQLGGEMEKTSVQMTGYRVDDQDGVSLTYQSCTCRLPVAFGGVDYLLHHDCDAAASGSPGAPLLVNSSSTETFILGIHSNRVGSGGNSLSALDDTTYEKYNDAVANRGVLAPYIHQHLSYLTAQGASSSGSSASSSLNSDASSGSTNGAASTSTSSGDSDEGEAEEATASSTSLAADSTDVATSSSSSMSPAVAVVCIGFVAVAWACVVFIATRRARRRRTEAPEPLIDGEQ